MICLSVQIVNEKNVQFSKLTGPLGAKEKGWYPDMPFSLSLMVAVDIYGHFVRQKKHLDTLAKMPTLIVQTEIDDSADHTVGLRIIKEIEERSGAFLPHPKLIFLLTFLILRKLCCSVDDALIFSI